MAEGDQVTQDRLRFLERLLESNTVLLNTEKQERNKQQYELNVSIWSDILKRFKRMRVEACQQRLEQLLPEINAKKKEVIEYHREHYAGRVSEAGLKRVEDVKVWLADEYLESGTGWRHRQVAITLLTTHREYQ